MCGQRSNDHLAAQDSCGRAFRLLLNTRDTCMKARRPNSAPHVQPRAVLLRTSRIYYWFVFVLVCGNVCGSVAAQHNEQCINFRDLETVGFPESVNILEIHVRSNVQGTVTIQDGLAFGSQILVELEKIAASEADLTTIATNQTCFETGHGMRCVVQIDAPPAWAPAMSVVVGLCIGFGIVLCLIVITIWYMRRRNSAQKFTSVHLQEGSRGQEPDDMPYDAAQNLSSTTDDRADERDGDGELPGGGEGRMMRGEGGEPGPSLPPPPRRTIQTSPSRPLSRTTVVAITAVSVVGLVMASCTVNTRIDVFITIPLTMHLRGGIKLFFNTNNANDVITDSWSQLNTTRLRVFDLDAVPITRNAPCQAESLCPAAYAADLGDCDAHTQQCVCERGYTISTDRGATCVDIDECASGTHGCPVTAVCQNTIGSFVCQCGYGYYRNHRQCKPCGGGCPEGYYEAGPCTNDGDRVCKACTECEGSMYEARPCGGSTDRQCIHAAHPLLITDEDTTITFVEGLSVVKSDNVVIEDLHRTKSLETTYYVTDNTQASDFYWVRESEIQVNMGILNVQLIPQYEDVDHDSDNKYMLENPNNSEDKNKFSKIVQKYCRNPIPDYYSITLEIAHDRITAAQPITCDSRRTDIPACPKGYNDGDEFLHRTLNEECRKMVKGTFPEPLRPAANSIVCTQNTALLRDIFNQTYNEERPIDFPSKRCKSSTMRCDQCINQPRCKHEQMDLFDQQCCQLDCYTQRDCKQASSPHCTNAPVECAMGDAYRYTIQPVFQHIKEEFQCHIRRKQPRVLYEMFYNIMLPSRGFKTPKQYKTVYATNLEYQSSGEFETDYITVTHDTGLNLEDEFILIGRDIPGSQQMNFSVNSLKTDEEFRQKKVKLHQFQHNIHIASTQFKRPFGYSTSSWVRGNDCDKDVDMFKSQQKHYRLDGQPVTVVTENVHHPFQYNLKSITNPPYIRFTAPGNTSVLSWYYKNNGPKLVKDGTLRAVLKQESPAVWLIEIEGHLTGCPGYVGITINNRIDMEELVKYDLLVFCPASFNLSVKLPNRGQDPDKTFDIKLQDGYTSFPIYLTHMIFEQDRLERAAQIGDRVEVEADTWTNIMIAVCVVAVASVASVLVYVYLECTKVSKISSTNDSYKHPSTHMTHVQQSGHPCFGRYDLTQGQITFIICYALIRFLYSLIFTFTVFFAVVFMFVHQDVDNLKTFGDFQLQKHNSSRQKSSDITQYGQVELHRQAKLVTSMQRACSYYIDELFTSMQEQMINVSVSNMQQEMYDHNSSISYLMYQRYQRHMDVIQSNMDNFTSSYKDYLDQKIDPKWIKYRKYLKQIYNNDYLQFPQLLFNRSNFGVQRPHAFHRSTLSGRESDFVAFLEIEEIEAVQLWNIQFWQRYNAELPQIPVHPVPIPVDLNAPQCSLPQAVNMSSRLDTSSQRLDSSRYFAPADQDAPTKSYDMFTTQPLVIILQQVNMSLFNVIFMVIDILLITYRCCRTYTTVKTLCYGFKDVTSVRQEVEYETDTDAKTSELQNLRNQMKHNPQGEAARQYYGGNQEYDGRDTGGEYGDTPLHQQRQHHPHLHHPQPPPRGILQPTSNHDTTGTHNPATNTATPTQRTTNTRVTLPTQTVKKPNLVYTLLCFFNRLIQNNIVPKLLLCTVIFVMLYFAVTCVTDILSIDILIDIDALRPFVMGLEVQVNQTNWYLEQQAEHFNQVTMKIYHNQMTSELLNLESMLTYFNDEQRRLVQNYVSEACVVNGDMLINSQCNVDLVARVLDIPVLPCNFVPVQPQVYTGFQEKDYIETLGGDFEPYTTSVRNLIVYTSYCMLSTLVAIITINIAGSLLFFFLKSRYKFTVHKIYLSSFPPRGGLSLRSVHGACAITDSEDEDHESGFRRYRPRGRGAEDGSAGPAHPQDYSRTDTLLTDFKYSETKV